MRKLIITTLFISMVSFVFANNIKEQTIKNDVKQIELVKQNVPNTLQVNEVDKNIAMSKVNPNVRFTCAYEAADGTVYVTEGWGLTGPAAMRSCARRLARIL